MKTRRKSYEEIDDFYVDGSRGYVMRHAGQDKGAGRAPHCLRPGSGGSDNGTLNALGASGLVLRITITPIHTNENASNVPILTI